ncbi:hypothetical protein HWV62_26727 [Athelia sp. TMB]|nr:hypothetical protein HWV62_26727 [Athelia sp. TMB]
MHPSPVVDTSRTPLNALKPKIDSKLVYRNQALSPHLSLSICSHAMNVPDAASLFLSYGKEIQAKIDELNRYEGIRDEHMDVRIENILSQVKYNLYADLECVLIWSCACIVAQRFEYFYCCGRILQEKSPSRMNVIVFGESGAGKSSLVNLLAGQRVAETSSNAKGCTFESKGYEVDIQDGPAIKLWDTAGLEEGDGGQVNHLQAVTNIYTLTRQLEDGVCLMMYCFRGRITKNAIKNYQMFKDFCNDKVPIALVVTGLEHELDKEAWWIKNVEQYSKAGFRINDHACITTLDSPHWHDEYSKSALRVRALISTTYLPTPWREERGVWLVRSVEKFLSMAFSLPSGSSQPLQKGLLRWGYSKADVKAAVKMFTERKLHK